MGSGMRMATGFALGLWTIVIICTLILIAGCSTVQPYVDRGLDAAVDVNDAFLANAERAYCDGPTHGALNRRYGADKAIQEARNNLCGLITTKYYNAR